MVVQRSCGRLCTQKSIGFSRLHDRHSQHDLVEDLQQLHSPNGQRVARNVAPRMVLPVVQVVQPDPDQSLPGNSKVEQVVQARVGRVADQHTKFTGARIVQYRPRVPRPMGLTAQGSKPRCQSNLEIR
jgi:hypothetical protein